MTARASATVARRLASAVIALLVLSGCGDSGTATGQSSSSPDVPATATTPPGSPTTRTPSSPTSTSSGDVTGAPTSPPSARDTADPGPSGTATPSSEPVARPDLPTGLADPVRIEVPAIGVDAAVVDLSLGNGDPEVPEGWGDAGWYTQTRNPGEIGPSVIAGHIDSKEGPAVFFRLDELVAGDEVILHGDGGDSRTFVVTDSGQYPKTDLPDEVFGYGQRVPELRLITCGGTFDPEAGHYRDNHVVYTRLAD